MLDIPSITGIVAAVGVLVGVVLAVLELRNITKTRQMELIMSIYSLFGTRQYMDAWEKLRTSETKDYDGYVKKHGLKDLMQVASLFEGLGFLLHKKFLDIDLVRELMNESTKMAWEKMEPMIEDAGKRLSQRELGEYVPVYQWFAYLYNEMQKSEQRLQQTQQ
ncbi:MAG: hypothetical protein JSV57_01185 [Candidatus Bathyarchaeota archaeon]|nr:MAG: hypothetical protein JSV57_01185 [Candidatus Bathyarchaeota archaeon]